MAADALVADVAACLDKQRIPVMPMKGALLQHWLYDDPTERPMTDVDLLVAPRDLDRAVRVLCDAGYRPTAHASVGGRVLQTRFGLSLDLHPHLFGPGRFRMPTGDLFARGTRDTSLFGQAVRLPSPLDVYAHLIGKFAADHLTACASERLDEISRMGAYLNASPEETSAHLIRCGMRRVSRYVLPLVHVQHGDAFAGEVHRALPHDPLGTLLATLAEAALTRLSRVNRAGAVVTHLLNDSVPRGLRSGVLGWRHHRRW